MANVIDAFLVTLGLDSSNFKKGADEANQDQKKLRDESGKTAQHMKEQGKTAGEFFTGLIAKAGEFLGIMASVEGLKSFSEEMLHSEDAGVKFARMMDIDVRELQGWQRAVALEGGSAEELNSSLRQTTSNLALIAIHGPRAQMALRLFAGLGIHEADLKGKNAIQVFEMLLEKMKGMSGGMALGLGMRLGLSEGTIRLLMKGKEGVSQLVEEEKKLGTYTADEASKAEELNDSMENVKTQFEMVGQKALVLLMPALQGVANILLAIGDWAKKHPTIVQAAILGIAVAAAVLAVSLAPIVLELLPIELTTLAIAAAVGLVAAGLTWVYLEWRKWMAGGTSSLGEFFKFFSDVWSQIRDIVMTVIGFMKQIFMESIKTIKDEFMFFFDLFTGRWQKAGEKFKDVVKDLSNVFMYVIKFLYYSFWVFVYELENMWKNSWDHMEKRALDAMVKIKESLGSLGIIGQLITPGAAYAYPGGGGSSQSTAYHKTVSVGTVEIHTPATDARGIASTIGPAIQTHSFIDQADGGM